MLGYNSYFSPRTLDSFHGYYNKKISEYNQFCGCMPWLTKLELIYDFILIFVEKFLLNSDIHDFLVLLGTNGY